MPDVPVEELDADYDLLTGGVVDSLGLLTVVAWLETEFDIAVDDAELGPGELPHGRRDQGVRRPVARGHRMPTSRRTRSSRPSSTGSTPSPRSSGATSGTAWGHASWPRARRWPSSCTLSTRMPDGASVAAMLRSLRARNPQPDPPAQTTVNIVGTGGGPSTFNLSTASAFVAAAMGARVIKTGSRAYASKTGSIDLLDRLGLKLTNNYEQTEEMLETFGIACAGGVRLPEGAAAARARHPAVRDEADGAVLQPGRPVPGRGPRLDADHGRLGPFGAADLPRADGRGHEPQLLDRLQRARRATSC